MDTMTCKHTIEDAHSKSIYYLVYSPSGGHLVSVSDDNYINIYDSKTYECLNQIYNIHNTF